jgi:hypothetical protein
MVYNSPTADHNNDPRGRNAVVAGEVDMNEAANDEEWEGDDEGDKENKARDRKMKKTDIRQRVIAQRAIDNNAADAGFQKRKADESTRTAE